MHCLSMMHVTKPGVATAGAVTTALGGLGAGYGGVAMAKRTAEVPWTNDK